MPVGFTITAGGVSIGAQVRPGVRIVRGMDVGATLLTPRASSCSMVLDSNLNVAVGDELVVAEPGGDAFFTGTVRDVSQGKDRNNVRRWNLSADGPIRELAAAGRGFTSDYMLAQGVSASITQLLGAGGVTGDVGASARELALFYIDEDVPLWRQVLTMLRTAGPRARLFELGDGTLRFRDEAPGAAARTVRGRASGLASGGLVSNVDLDEAGRDRVVNSVTLEATSAAATLQVVAELWAPDDGGRAEIALSAFTGAGIESGDQIVFFAMGQQLTSQTRYFDPGGMIDAARSVMGGENISGQFVRAGLYATTREWPQTAAAEVQIENASGTRIGGQINLQSNLLAVITRGGAAPVVGSQGSTAAAGSLMLTALRVVYNVGGANPTPPSVSAPSGWTLIGGNPGTPQGLFVARRISDGMATFPATTDWTVGSTPDSRLATVGHYEIAEVHALIWEDSQASRTLAPDETIFVAASADEPFTDVVAPVAGTDFTVNSGSIVSATIATLRTPTSVTIVLTAGSNGATISGLQLRGAPLTRDVTAAITAENAASIAQWDERRAQSAFWPYLDATNAQALADAVVDYGAQPRRLWSVMLDADRDADTLAAALDTELGDVLTCNVDADLNQDGEVVRIEHFIGAGETLETKFTLLATVPGIAPPSTATHPGQVMNLVLTEQTATSFRATWDMPADGGSPILHYDVQYRRQTTTVWLDESSHALAHIVASLVSGETYEARVRAANIVGDGPWSAIATVTLTAQGAALELESGGDLLLESGGRLLLE